MARLCRLGVRILFKCRNLKVESWTEVCFGSQKSRNFSQEGDHVVLEKWERDILSMGSLTANVPFSVHIKPLNVDNHPLMNKAIVQFVANLDEGIEGLTEKKIRELYNVRLNTTDTLVDICGSLTEKGQDRFGDKNPFECHVQLPLKYDVNVQVNGYSSTAVAGLESDLVSVVTEKGNITSKHLKCGTIKLHSKFGKIDCLGVMQGNIDIATGGRGKVIGMRFQGQNIKVQTDKGAIEVSAVYADKSLFHSKDGDMNLENYHGNGIVRIERGNLKVSGLDGTLTAEIGEGNISVQVSRLEGLEVSTESGNIEIKVPENLPANLQLKGKELDLEKRLRVQGEENRSENINLLTGCLGAIGGATIVAVAPNGCIKLSIQDWLSSLQLGEIIPEIAKPSPRKPLPLGG